MYSLTASTENVADGDEKYIAQRRYVVELRQKSDYRDRTETLTQKQIDKKKTSETKFDREDMDQEGD